MVKTTTTTNAAQQATQPTSYKISAKIVSIGLHPKDESRYLVTLSQEFDSYNEKGEPTKSSTFGINYYNLQKQLTEISQEFAMASAMALGQRINRQIVALLLNGANVEITRTFKAKGEEREYQREGEAIKVYENDTYTSHFDKATLAPSQLALGLVQQLMLTKPTDTIVTAVATQATQFNPFI